MWLGGVMVRASAIWLGLRQGVFTCVGHVIHTASDTP